MGLFWNQRCANGSSSVVPSRRRPFPSVCSLSGRCIRSCEYCPRLRTGYKWGKEKEGRLTKDDNRTAQILLTAAMSSISFFSEGYRTWIQGNFWLLMVSLFGAIGFMLVTYWKRKSYPANLLFLSAFTIMEAYSISVVTSLYESRIVVLALVFTLGIFVALTAFACQSKYDFTNWMPYLFGGLWFLILFGFMAAFFPRNSTMELVYGGASALIFSGYILVDTQLVMRHYHVEEEIAAAISLYLDILNLFLAILRILNNQNNN